MSKERELLKRWVLDFGKIHPDVELLKDTKELLAQPVREPVAWMWEENTSDGWVENIADTDKPPENEYRRNIRPLYLAPPKQTEQEDIYQKLLKVEEGLEAELLPSELWLDGYEAGKRTMQSKQEPVAWIIQTEVEGKLLEWVCTDKKHYMEAHDTIKKPIPLYAGSPKREPLSDEKLEIMYSKHAFAMDKQEYMWGFRDAEKAHNIGGGE